MTSQSNLSLIAVGVVSFVTGFYVHQMLKPTSSKRFQVKPTSATTTTKSEDDSEDEEEEEDEGLDINSLALNEIPGEVRMTLVVRQDLKMGKGKAAAQCSHATLALYKKITNPQLESYNPELVNRWELGNGQAKITLQVPNQEEMDLLYAKAISLGINSYIVHDAGRTQIAAGSATVLGLGPAPKRILDEVTGDLKLY
ncbi:peptidyl-tRNA hydrolase [Candida albicans P57072]|nr:peptidyl-tRNA hydrolase [Candida albicans P57072]KHC29537.1 peptidyl-tRNA hydrolase [Candida albicans P76055]